MHDHDLHDLDDDRRYAAVVVYLVAALGSLTALAAPLALVIL